MEREHAIDMQLVEALNQLRSAIALLDQSRAPAHIAAHVDLATHQLEELIESRSPAQSGIQIDANAEPH